MSTFGNKAKKFVSGIFGSSSKPEFHKSDTISKYESVSITDTQLEWKKKPCNILICKKIREIQCTKDLIDVSYWLLTDKQQSMDINKLNNECRLTNVYVLPPTYDELKNILKQNTINDTDTMPDINPGINKQTSMLSDESVDPLDSSNIDTCKELLKSDKFRKINCDIKGNINFKCIDFMIVIGGDGTLLHLISLFKGKQTIPPILAFQRGSLGFLAPYQFNDYKKIITDIRNHRTSNNVCVRMRLMGRVWRHKKNLLTDLCPKIEQDLAQENRGIISMTKQQSVTDCNINQKQKKRIKKLIEMNKNNDEKNEIAADNEIIEENVNGIQKGNGSPNGSSSNVADQSFRIINEVDETLLKTSSIFPEHECVTRIYHALNEVLIHRDNNASMMSGELYINGVKTTLIQSDGIIFSTPTGSTAYNISAGGCLISPTVPCIGITPICPHTLSFRPVILSQSSIIHVKIPENSRYNAIVNFDGKHSTQLYKGDVLEILKSPFPVSTFKHDSFQQEWFSKLATKFNWNVREEQKPHKLNNDYN